jgi:phosphatidate phosphatase PAH1
VTGAPQILIGKFAYGSADDDLKDEEVDVHVQRGCAGAWEKLGTALTTQDDQHVTVEDVPDSGGRIYFEVPAARALPEGRHRVAMVVAGDRTMTDLVVDVVPPKTRFVVSDVDGTLTTSELAEVGAIVTGGAADAHPDAPKVLTKLAAKGYRPFFLTARPDVETARTREFLAERGFPRGIVHTTAGSSPLTGDAAVAFKNAELGTLQKKGALLHLGFGNTESDADAYANAALPQNGRIFYRFTDQRHGGRRIEAYKELLGDIDALAPACR